MAQSYWASLETIARQKFNEMLGVQGSSITATGTENALALPTGGGILALDFRNASTLTINGIVAAAEAQVLFILVHSSSAGIVISNESGSAATTDKIRTPTNADVAMAARDNAILIYDSVSGRWVLAAKWATTPTFIAPRVQSITSSGTPTPNASTDDMLDVTALATAPTFGAPTGTAVNGQKLIVRIKDNGTLRALAWNAAYVAGGVSLPTTTVASKILTIGFIYNTANSLNKWQCVAVAQEA